MEKLEQNATSEEMAENNKSRILSDAELIKEGAEVNAENVLVLSEKQLKEARDEMYAAGKLPSLRDAEISEEELNKKREQLKTRFIDVINNSWTYTDGRRSGDILELYGDEVLRLGLAGDTEVKEALRFNVLSRFMPTMFDPARGEAFLRLERIPKLFEELMSASGLDSDPRLQKEIKNRSDHYRTRGRHINPGSDNFYVWLEHVFGISEQK